LASHGAGVAINFRREAEAAAELVAEIEAGGGRAFACQGDVSARDDCSRIVGEVAEALGGLDILVHNAGVLCSRALVADAHPDELEVIMRVNAFGPVHLTQLALPHLRQAGRADIIYLSSIATKVVGPGMAFYNMAKAAGEAFALTLSKEESRHGIRTNIVAPGLTDTDMGRELVHRRGAEFDAAASRYPFGRAATPDDVANLIAFLVSDANGYINGERIYVDGSPALSV
jgi:NAD(P)-dependent dehydrogenase (short-subunit alcohol dehydrogenase family)